MYSQYEILIVLIWSIYSVKNTFLRFLNSSIDKVKLKITKTFFYWWFCGSCIATQRFIWWREAFPIATGINDHRSTFYWRKLNLIIKSYFWYVMIYWIFNQIYISSFSHFFRFKVWTDAWPDLQFLTGNIVTVGSGFHNFEFCLHHLISL